MSDHSGRKLLPKPPDFKEPARKSPQRPPPPPPSDDEDDRNKKGRRISTACLPCRNRKTRCDGKKPCSACVDRQSSCRFDYLSDRRRRVHVAKDAELLNSRRDKLVKIIQAVRTCSDEAFDTVMDMISKGDSLSDVSSYVEEVQASSEEPESSARAKRRKSESVGTAGLSSLSFGTEEFGGSSAPSPLFARGSSSAEVDERTARFPYRMTTESGVDLNLDPALSGTMHSGTQSSTGGGVTTSPGRRPAGPLSAFPVWQYTAGPDSLTIPAHSGPEPEAPDPLILSIARSVSSWTSAIIDPESISYLFSLYKSVWGASVYFFIDFDLFLRDMVPCVMSGEMAGTDLFFGCDLANAFLAVSCFFCTKKFAFGDEYEPGSRGEHFMQEAHNQIKAFGRPCLTTAQAYACLALADGCRGRLGSSRRLWFRCFDIFLELLGATQKASQAVESESSGGRTGNPSLFWQAPHLGSGAEQMKELQASPQPHQGEIDREKLRYQVKKSVIALGLFCVESIYLTEINAPSHEQQSGNMSTHNESLVAASAASSRLAAILSSEEAGGLIDVVANLKAELETHNRPPGFLTPEYQNAEELLGSDTAETVSMAYPVLGFVYKQLSTLWGKLS